MRYCVDEVSSYKFSLSDFKRIKTQLVSLGLVELTFITETYEGWDETFGKAMKTGVSLVWKLTKAGERRYAELAAMRHYNFPITFSIESLAMPSAFLLSVTTVDVRRSELIADRNDSSLRTIR